MMLKTLAVLMFVAACAAFPLEDGPNEEGGKVPLPVVGPQGAEPKGDESDLKTDSSHWGYYPVHTHYSYYRPRAYYPSYYSSYWHYW